MPLAPLRGLERLSSQHFRTGGLRALRHDHCGRHCQVESAAPSWAATALSDPPAPSAPGALAPQIRTVWSSLAEAKSPCCAGLHATAVTGPECPRSTSSSAPSARRQMYTPQSSLLGARSEAAAAGSRARRVSGGTPAARTRPPAGGALGPARRPLRAPADDELLRVPAKRAAHHAASLRLPHVAAERLGGRLARAPELPQLELIAGRAHEQLARVARERARADGRGHGERELRRLAQPRPAPLARLHAVHPVRAARAKGDGGVGAERAKA